MVLGLNRYGENVMKYNKKLYYWRTSECTGLHAHDIEMYLLLNVGLVVDE